ncbi:MAG: hypothetical protein COA38_07250 [Fluviicola sp.]|nr:MAG: hypothetical protein COA38_07250 [Fluviicola sp.]
MIDQNKLDALFLKAKGAPHTSVFNETKEQFLIASSGNVEKKSSKKSHFKTFNKGIIMLVIAGAITLMCFFVSNDVEEGNTQNIVQTKVELESKFTEKKPPIEAKNTSQNLTDRTSEVSKVKGIISFASKPVSNPVSDPIRREMSNSDSDVTKKKFAKPEQSGDFVFPKLTEKEISDNHRRKKKMIKAVNKKDSKVYSYIPAGSFTYMSKPISVAAFHMQRTEVTNLEYKTFLFDLLIQDRKADFLVAKPKQELWIEELGEEYRFMQDDYFSGEDYEDYPVNNISRKGAEMYCVWITREANRINKENGKMLINDVRIPMRSEWVKAATVEGKFPEYSFVDSNLAICFRSNFSLGDYEPPRVTKKRTGEEISFGHRSALTSWGFLAGEKKIMAKSKFYSSNDYGLYNVSGNVAEMVYESLGANDLSVRTTPREVGTAGGGWMNTHEEIKLNAEDQYQGVEDAHINIGFRVVISYASNPR